MINKSLNLYVIGCGGIGGFLINLLPQAMASVALDCMATKVSDPAAFIGTNMSNGGVDFKQTIFKDLVLIDGDTFDDHNSLRQAGVIGSKLAVQMEAIRRQAAFSVWLNSCSLKGYNNYITPDNAGKIIAQSTETTMPVVFLCVDNHKTRYEVSRFAELFDDILLINGGNSKTAGNVTIYERRNNVALDPAIYEIYPEVAAGTDKRPDETACTDVAPENDQVAIVNNMIASIMLGKLMQWVKTGGFEEKTPRKDAQGNNITVRKNEVILDLERFTMMQLTRTKKEE